MSINISSKRIQIDKSIATMVSVIAISSFVTIFCLVASRAVLQLRSYQSHVIVEKEKAKKQLEDNIKNVAKLRNEYKAFVGSPENVIGGSTTGSGDRDGDNAKIVLDALPSKYDFPALAVSLNRLFAGNKGGALSGSDDEIAQSAKESNATPKPIEISFSVSTSGSYLSSLRVIGTLERSIRPINIKSLTITAADDEIKLGISALTYYQPAKSLKITTKDVK